MSEALQIQLRKGVLEMCVLALLSREDGYAYDIAARLAELIGMGEGTIYPLMRRMQSDGLVTTYLAESDSGPPRKYYRLTEQGHRRAIEMMGVWDSFAGAMSNLLSPMRRPSNDENGNRNTRRQGQ